jgi:hydrogenase maturation protease
MKTKFRKVKAPLAIIGIGNPIAGDDGAGIKVVRRLKKLHGNRRKIIFHELTGDLLEMADRLDEAHSFIFCDALRGDNPGEILTIRNTTPHSFSASFHQNDIASVMHSLKALNLVTPFPQWEILGICIAAPTYFSKRLTLPVSRAIIKCVGRLTERIS